jgi:hypothetical protein
MRVVSGGLTGAVIGAVLCAAAFLLGALADRTGPAEALGYSLIVAIIGFFLGGIAGAAIGLFNLKAFGGALAGLLVALAVVGFYVVAFGREGESTRFLGESRILIVGLTTPLVLTGTATAWLNSLARRRQEDARHTD